MKTQDILIASEYDAIGGPILAVPASLVEQFCQRIKNRLVDIDNGNMTFEQFADEIDQTIRKLY
jgi:hypothetical protein